MIAQKNPEIKIDAIEIHEDGSQECRENFALSPWSERLTVFKGDYFDFQFKGTYDLIFSNPPYHLDTLKSLDEDVSRAKHADPFLISEFFKRVDSLLTREGKFWIIFPFSGLNYLIKTGEEYNLFPTKIFFVHAKSSKPNKRVIICYQRNQINPVVKRDIIIRNENNQYTSEYKEITNTFHWEFMM
ncbi:MAG: methyltransferase, partial [Bacteroidetes bacterium]|nr:methyltransferase [Bacteroidota bacterium]